MKNTETIKDFYQRHGQDYSHAGQFNIYRREEFACHDTSLPPNRRDFYKISLVTKGEGILSYADKSIQLKNSAITFLNPLIPYAWGPTTEDQTGYFCLFTEDFINQNKAESLSQSPLFRVGGNHILIPDDEKMHFLSGIFENMLTEMQSTYIHKYDLLRNYIQIIIHEALKIQPPETKIQHKNAHARISSLFLELLDRQFPIDAPQHTLSFKTANEFADQLSIHTNHLNRALKETTGKTTTQWISERVVQEAKSLLLHSSWNISEIGYCLGFEHASNFNIFFKKQVGSTPKQFRQHEVVMS
ncbi:AraC family transcriptional regulator [Rapidithrix thailandica]|uniref:AraC family transcriptional regulator n=1 Tax=Rapidithrix thailandica TaxID=413964 RepID=A0AAW9RX00_9BACT